MTSLTFLKPSFALLLTAAWLAGCASSSATSGASQVKRGGNFIQKTLVQQKVDLGQPVRFRYFLELPSETSAMTLKPALESEGYDVAIEGPDKSARWTCVAAKTFVPIQDSPEARYFELKKRARARGGNLFTWQAEVLKKP
jgi:hypothetical protein